MLRWFLRRQVAAFERAWKYDASYLRRLIDVDPRAMLAFGKLQAIVGYRRDVPPAVYAAAGLAAVIEEDCGPCTQLGIDMAQQSGVDPALLRAIVMRDFAAMPEEVALAVRFTEATLGRSGEADGLREQVVRRFGQRGLISLAFAMLAARMYPTLKYALGHGQACRRLTIGGKTLPVLRDARQPTRAATAA
ncbi:MAG TPA: hypothetical protein VFA50_13010 [Stellaceae bacterium]|nr:hypothetical protein [Stellaceae bacterium]